MHTAGGEGYKLVLLLQLALGCVIHEFSVLLILLCWLAACLPGPPPGVFSV
jgi:hypothetical protein